MKHPMIGLVWDSIQAEGEVKIHANFFSIDATAQKDMLDDWIGDLNKLNFQIRTDQPITELALPRLKRLFFGHRKQT
jgi:hypothetical protein